MPEHAFDQLGINNPLDDQVTHLGRCDDERSKLVANTIPVAGRAGLHGGAQASDLGRIDLIALVAQQLALPKAFDTQRVDH